MSGLERKHPSRTRTPTGCPKTHPQAQPKNVKSPAGIHERPSAQPDFVPRIRWNPTAAPVAGRTAGSARSAFVAAATASARVGLCRNQRSACSVRYARRASGLLDPAQHLQSLAAVRGRVPLRPDVEAPAKPERPPLAEVVLQAGDMLYVPRGWWHAVAATERWSLHRAAGVRPDPSEPHLRPSHLGGPGLRHPPHLRGARRALRPHRGTARGPVRGAGIQGRGSRIPAQVGPLLPTAAGPAASMMSANLTAWAVSPLPGGWRVGHARHVEQRRKDGRQPSSPSRRPRACQSPRLASARDP
ncbi:hypothetical protein M2167_001029 [Streptomyces sp. SPB4]|nr:hypothetical protein [Streptomyces sp. SPB4]